jgi:hypothetical protein
VTGYVTLCNGGCPDIDCPLDTMPPDTLDDLKLYAEAIGLNLGVAQRL